MQSASEAPVLRRGRAVAAVTLGLLGLGHLLYHCSYTLDDACISFRYARNLARGAGLVYNPGEYVKGYSNTLYTVLMAIPEWFRLDPFSVAKAIGFLSFGVLCWLGYRLYAADADPAVTDRGVWLLALFAISASIAVHYMNGLETGLHTTLVFAAVVARLREQRSSGKPWSALLFAGVALGRPEGILLFAAMAVHDALFRAITRSFSRRDLVFYMLPPLAYAAELAVSAAYYGDPLPQTYYAKARVTHGIANAARVFWEQLHKQLNANSYLGHGLEGTGFSYGVLAIALLAFVGWKRWRQSSAFLLVLLAQLVFVVRAGDDWAPGFRFGVPGLPLMFALLVEAIAVVALLARRYSRPVGWVLVTIALVLALPRNITSSRWIQARKFVDARRLLHEGVWLAALAEPGVTLSSFDIGGQGYAAGGFDILDPAGLVLRETTRCRNRMLPACTRYALLVSPELVRRHPGLRKDAFVAQSVRTQEPYLELAAGRYLIKRSLVLVEHVPDWAVLMSQAPGPNGVRVTAHDLSPVLRSDQETNVTIYWMRDPTVPAGLLQRKLEWRGAKGTFSAHESEVLWHNAVDTDAWKPNEVFADHARLRAPSAVGRYELRAKLEGGQSQTVAFVDVVGAGAAIQRSNNLVALAQQRLHAGDEPSALRIFGQAVQLDSNRDSRRLYHQAVVARALRLRRAAEPITAIDPLRALRTLQEAKVLLHRAYWEASRMTPALRSEIDANAAQRTEIIARDLSAQPKRRSLRKKAAQPPSG